MTEREFKVNRIIDDRNDTVIIDDTEFKVNKIIHDASATVIIDDTELVGLDDDEKNDLIMEQAMEQDVWRESYILHLNPEGWQGVMRRWNVKKLNQEK